MAPTAGYPKQLSPHCVKPGTAKAEWPCALPMQEGAGTGLGGGGGGEVFGECRSDSSFERFVNIPIGLLGV